MDLSDPNPAATVTTDSTQAIRLLTTLFDKSDLILFRPIETCEMRWLWWTLQVLNSASRIEQ